MVKKRKQKRLDQFLHGKKQSKEAVLQAKTRLSNRLFRAGVGGATILALLALVPLSDWHSRVGLALLFGLVVLLGASFVTRAQPGLFDRVASFNQFVTLVLGTVLISKLVLVLGWSPYFMPVPIMAMVLSLAYSRLVALLVSIALSCYLALLTPGAIESLVAAGGAGPGSQRALPVIDAQLAVVMSLGAVTAALGVENVRKQSRPVFVGFLAGVVQAVAIFCFLLLPRDFDLSVLRSVESGRFWQDSDVLSFLQRILHEPGFGLASGLIAGGVVTSLLPLIERVFGVVTERRLLELADPSNTLLRVLRERAPGTFQHTLGVQQLARGAAEAIGANVLLTDVGAYYHDIGKIHKPEYFVENMGEDKSIHDRLRPSMSKLIIISHVKDGILLAREERLPEKVIEMIPMHHGTTVVEFFFQKARRECDESDVVPAEDVEYRYPGPRPTFAEAGILMLADAAEAIAKVLPDPTPNAFREMVRKVIQKRMLDHQLDECNLTLADLHKIEDSFVRTLTNMYHSRIKYPAGAELPPAPEAEGSREKRGLGVS